ncbi:MAG: 3-hydroxyacyl-ACP dehydratase FabZ [Clostridia bacterium]
MNIEAVMTRLPHRYPFLLVDRVLERTPGQSVHAIKNVTVNEPFFEGHFPGHPIMPGVLILEAMAQAAGLALDDREGAPLGVLTGVDKARMRRMVTPGDQLHLYATLTRQRGRLVRAETRAEVEGRPAAEAEILFMLMEDRRDPAAGSAPE